MHDASEQRDDKTHQGHRHDGSPHRAFRPSLHDLGPADPDGDDEGEALDCAEADDPVAKSRDVREKQVALSLTRLDGAHDARVGGLLADQPVAGGMTRVDDTVAIAERDRAIHAYRKRTVEGKEVVDGNRSGSETGKFAMPVLDPPRYDDDPTEAGAALEWFGNEEPPACRW